MSEESDLSILYHGSNGKYSCQPFFLSLLPDKNMNLEKLLSEITGILKVEPIPHKGCVILDAFLDEEGELLRKIEIKGTHLIDKNTAIILTSQEKETPVYFRGQNYLLLKTNFIFTKIEYVKDTYYLYVFAKENSIKEYIEVLGNKMGELGLNIGEFSLSKKAISELQDELGGDIKEFGLNNVTPRLKSIRGKGIDLQNDDAFKELRGNPNAEVYHYMIQIDEPHSDLNLEKLTVSIRKNCFVHSYHHITYDGLLHFVRENVIPKSLAMLPVHHPLSAYDKLEIYEA